MHIYIRDPHYLSETHFLNIKVTLLHLKNNTRKDNFVRPMGHQNHGEGPPELLKLTGLMVFLRPMVLAHSILLSHGL